MTTASMSQGQITRFIAICQDQGVKVTRTKKGLLLRFPDGSSTVQHFTNSDFRATQNQIARFRRAGVTHPEDPRGPSSLPTYITSGKISEKTRQRILTVMKDLGYPEAVLSSTVVKQTGMDPGWANRALYHCGFRPGPAKNKKVGRPWYTPDEILALKQDASPVDEPIEPTEEVRADEVEEPAVDRICAHPDCDMIAVPGHDYCIAHSERPPIGEPDPEVERALSEIVDDQEHVEKALGAGVEGAREAGRQLGRGMREAGLIPDASIYRPPATTEQAETALPSLDFVKPVGHEGEHLPVRNPAVVDEHAVKVESNGREFIDSYDSWAVDKRAILGEHLDRMVTERLEVLTAVGMEYEIRVWRKK